MNRWNIFRGLRAAPIAVSVLACCGLGAAPARALDVDHEGWFQVTGTGPIAGPVRGFFEVQPRIGERNDSGDVDMRLLIVRAALGIEVLPHWSLWAGYGYTPTFHPDRDEHRVFQQSLYERPLGPLNFSLRTRLEQRGFEDAEHASLRLRNQVRFAYPLPRWPRLSLVTADEFFVNLNTVTDAPVSGFDQNRYFVGLSYQLTQHVRVEVDYLNQIVNGRHGREDTLRHNGFLQLAFGW